MPVVVKRDGSVVDESGKVVGRIESRPAESIAHALMGTESARKEYRGVRADGLETAWRAKRRDAVYLLEGLCKPPSAEVSIRANYSGRKMFSGSVSWDGNSASVTSYAHEVDESGARLWVVDALMPAGAIMPTFCNGEGTRCTAAYVLKGKQKDMMDAALAASGLTVDALA